MIPALNQEGTLPPGVHWGTWDEFLERFAFNAHRERLASGLRRALEALRQAGCMTVFVNGSFVTNKEIPADYDACWDMTDVDPDRLDPVLLQFDNQRAAQKAKYFGELFPAQTLESTANVPFVAFFQRDKESGDQKGIVALDLRRI